MIGCENKSRLRFLSQGVSVLIFLRLLYTSSFLLFYPSTLLVHRPNIHIYIYIYRSSKKVRGGGGVGSNVASNRPERRHRLLGLRATLAPEPGRRVHASPGAHYENHAVGWLASTGTMYTLF